MAWKIEYSPRAKKSFTKLDIAISKKIWRFLQERVAQNPRKYGKVLTGPLGEFRRYRAGDYRILVNIENERLVVLVVQIGYRSKVYSK